jgi:hypothetical protein
MTSSCQPQSVPNVVVIEGIFHPRYVEMFRNADIVLPAIIIPDGELECPPSLDW